MTETTVWTHIEKLVGEKEVTAEEIKHLEPTDIDWNAAKQTLNAAMDKHGIEKLKPIYEAADEGYDYTLVRLARMQYWLEEGEVVF